jgi:hypothetical protein
MTKESNNKASFILGWMRGTVVANLFTLPITYIFSCINHKYGFILVVQLFMIGLTTYFYNKLTPELIEM